MSDKPKPEEVGCGCASCLVGCGVMVVLGLVFAVSVKFLWKLLMM